MVGRITLAILIWLVAPQADAKLVITGVVDGPLTGGLPKAVEVYATGAIADLSIYGMGSANNGGGSDGQEFTFPNVAVAAGSFLYVASESTGFADFFGFTPNYASAVASINGDDAIELYMNGAVIDVFGDINVSGVGQPWQYTDGWAYRMNQTGPDGTAFVDGHFIYSGPNALDGEATNAAALSPFPLGVYAAVPEPSAFLYGGLVLLVCGVGRKIRGAATDDEMRYGATNIDR